jgi:hypothetical protein
MKPSCSHHSASLGLGSTIGRASDLGIERSCDVKSALSAERNLGRLDNSTPRGWPDSERNAQGQSSEHQASRQRRCAAATACSCVAAHCLLTTGGDTYETVAALIVQTGVEFTLLEPLALAQPIREIAARLLQGLDAIPDSDSGHT